MPVNVEYEIGFMWKKKEKHHNFVNFIKQSYFCQITIKISAKYVGNKFFLKTHKKHVIGI